MAECLSYPLHRLVWNNSFRELDRLLKKNEQDLESHDPRGRTPLHLAVTLGHMESARVLLQHGANASAENRAYWTVTQEAVSSGDPELVQLCLQSRDHQRYNKRTEGVPELLQTLREAPDFYVEMKWEFASWVPLVSRMCPSDTYKVWKSGANVRIDTTLLGFDKMNWQRGSRSFLFRGEMNSATVMEVDHDSETIYTEVMRILPETPDMAFMRPSNDAVAARLTSPIVTTYIDTEKIEFERNKSGIWGWRSDKTENVNGHECKVFGASNVELVTKTRTEHLTDQDKQKTKKTTKNPLESFLGMAEQENQAQAVSNGEVDSFANNPCHITPEEYFDTSVELAGRDIGRPMEQTTKTQKFKANLWLCEEYPLSLQEQVIPIIDLMASSNAHFRKLKDFITLQLPAGFPVKIEIPLFHVLNARITFGNIFALDDPVSGVNVLQDPDAVTCVVDDVIFMPPTSYTQLGDSAMRHERMQDEDDQLLQFAIQQSLMETGTESEKVTFWEALNKSKPGPALPPRMTSIQMEEERLLQRALEESILQTSGVATEEVPDDQLGGEDQLKLALAMSQEQLTEEEKRRKQEEEELEMILKLSLTEK